MYLSRVITIGNCLLGGHEPIRIQSMTNTSTLDTQATVSQTLELAGAGSELVRITARNVKEAENLSVIRKKLKDKGCDIPLIADIHFQPEAAMTAARTADKIRINPGNYFETAQNSSYKNFDSATDDALEMISNKMLPLLNICKEYGTAVRIGVNHGSLSQRIIQHYGNTVEGMVASAMEYIMVCRYHSFGNLVLSMKSSNVRTMIYAYRLLVKQMMAAGYDYPLHLGVTEAGGGNPAIVKSAMGIASLLIDGIGDTIRVSLTGNPVQEIPVAKVIAGIYSSKNCSNTNLNNTIHTFRKTEKNIAAAIVSANTAPPTDDLPLADYLTDLQQKKMTGLLTHETFDIVEYDESVDLASLNKKVSSVLLFDAGEPHQLRLRKSTLENLISNGLNLAVILTRRYNHITNEELLIRASAETGYFLCDGLGDGICIESVESNVSLNDVMSEILQAAGLKRYKAEFIACPTCGRTSYNVENTLEKISKALSHLSHLKIGVMGCIVNGPGEMADADYGYVGAAPGKISLYKGKNPVLKNIDESRALEELIKLIKENGDWR